jgi:glycopeptide antibiotics resistance protein
MIQGSPHRRVALLARAAYAGVICIATLSNLHLQPGMLAVRLRLLRAFDPSAFSLRVLVVDGVRNLLLFAGLGAVWMVTDRKGRTRRATVEATVAGALLSLTVETVQLWSPARYASMFDLMTNAGGALAGALAVALCIVLARHALARPGFMGVPAFIFAATYLGALLCAVLAPFYGAGSLGAHVPVLDAVLAAPGGAFLALVLLEAGARPSAAALGAAVLGPLVALGFGAARMLVGGAPAVGLGIAQAIGLAAGGVAAWVAPMVARRQHDPRRALLVLSLYAGALALWSWRPFALRTSVAEVLAQFTARHLVPMGAISLQPELLAVFDIGGQFLLFLPLGVLLAVWPLRTAGPLRHVLPALYLAVVLELGQALVAGRFLDVTDLLVRSAGAAVGLVVAQRAGATVHGEALGPTRPRDRRGSAGRIVRGAAA